jgi:LuxR family transcriptional regulator, maltose regulon positive regulatory protein
MQETLLSTKFNVPPSRQTIVFRSELMATLTKVGTHRLTLVLAPPGYGKTTLVSSWLRESNLPFTWLSLDEGDNDPIRFLEYFLTALHKVVPSIRLDFLDLLQGPQAASLESLMVLLINEAALAEDFFLVMDDFHVLHSQLILDMLAYLLEHVPPSMHIVLLSRTDPPLPLSRIRARGQLLDIRAEQLRFSVGEITLFFDDVMGLKLSDPEVSAIETRTEGWVAGLQLAGLAMQSLSRQGGNEPHSFISTFTGSHAYIMDYLTEEVLRHQPDKICSFLLQTSILERMCGPLCEAVVQPGMAEALDGHAILETLEQKHLFVIPLDDERHWYRYHHLFNEVLSRRLEAQFPRQILELHCRASKWYEQNGFIHEAIQHAMKSGDLDRTARLVEQHGCALLMGGEVVTLADWLRAIEPYIQVHPWLAMQKAWTLLFTGHPESAEKVIQVGEQLLSNHEQTDEVRTLRGSFAAARAHLANMHGKSHLAAEHAQRALGFLPESSDFSCSLRSVATSLFGDASWMQGKMVEAQQAYSEAVRIAQAAGNPHMVMMSNNSLADVLFERGQLHQAARIYTETLHLVDQVDGPNSNYAQNTHFGMGRVFYAWNRLDEAAASFEQCSRLSRQWGNINLQAACLVAAAQLERARGNLEMAQQAMIAAEELMKERPLSPTWLRWVEMGLARLWLDQGNIEKALFYVHNTGIYPNRLSWDSLSQHDIQLEDPILYGFEPVYLILLRLFLALSNPDAVLALCERLLPEAQTGERLKTVTEIYVLQALAFQSKKNLPLALAALERAVTLARPDQSRRVFLDEGERLGKLLYQLKAHSLGGEFLEELLSLINQHVDTQKSPALPIQNQLVEPLSARELDVLKCIAQGCSNQEIANQFVISPKTVKRHISNIYAKLEAKNRTQAVSLARALKLLD